MQENIKGLKSNFLNYPGVVVYEYELKIGWGKSVSLPSQALPAPPPGHMAIRSKEVGFFPLHLIFLNIRREVLI